MLEESNEEMASMWKAAKMLIYDTGPTTDESDSDKWTPTRSNPWAGCDRGQPRAEHHHQDCHGEARAQQHAEVLDPHAGTTMETMARTLHMAVGRVATWSP